MMEKIRNLLSIIGTLALIGFGFYAWTQWNEQQQDAPPVVIVEPAAVAPAPAAPIIITATPAAVQAVFVEPAPIVIPNPPNPHEVLAMTPVTATAEPTPTLAATAQTEQSFTLTTGVVVSEQEAQFLADCAYGQAKGRRVNPQCPPSAAELLGVGR